MDVVNKLETRVPGDNPNKRLAQRRKENRPKIGSMPRERTEEATKLQWVEPLAVPKMVTIEMQQIPHSVPAISFELNTDLPSNIVEPSTRILRQALDRTNLPEEDIVSAVSALEAQTYFKAARQLYSALNPDEKATLQPLKAVFYDDAQLPLTISSGLSMIGHFESKMGTAEIKYAMLLFKQWIYNGLCRVPESGLVPEGEDMPNAVLFKDKFSMQYMKDLIKEEFKRRHDTVIMRLQIAEIEVLASLPDLTNIDYASISDLYPDHDVLRALHRIMNCTQMQWDTQTIDGIPNAFTILYQVFGNITFSDIDIPMMRDLFEDFSASWRTDYKKHIQAVFNLAPTPTSGRGYAAQLIEAHELSTECKLPVSNTDLSIGYVYNPCKRMILNPIFKAYSRRKADVIAASFAEADTTPFASH